MALKYWYILAMISPILNLQTLQDLLALFFFFLLKKKKKKKPNLLRRKKMVFQALLYFSFCYVVIKVILTIRSFAQAKHCVPWANPQRLPPDPDLFPQYLQNKQGLWLYWPHWPVKRPRGVIFLVSGLGEHTVRYQMLSAKFNDAGFVTFSLDHQGHGASEGDRAHVERFQDYVDDYIQFVNTMLERNPELQKPPKFLLGHSMGGLIAVHVRNQSQEAGLSWTGTILSAPALRADPKVATPVKIFLAGVLSNFLPKLALDPLNSATVSRSKQVVELYSTDPLVYHGGIRARWGNEVLRAMRNVSHNYAMVTWPFLLLHGGDDRITHISGSIDFFEHVPSTDKILKTYQGMFHEVFNEPDRDIVIHDVLDFIEARVKYPQHKKQK